MKLRNFRKYSLAVLFITFTMSLFGQTRMTASNDAGDMAVQSDINDYVAETNVGVRSLTPTPQLAMSSSDYPVTAGDVFTLAFAAGTTPVTYTISLDSTYKFRVANLAVLNVQGWTFVQLKKQVEDIVSKNYPLSGVQFVLVSPAVFSVTVNGEVKQTEIKESWALTRLSSVVSGTFTKYSSNRDITITSANGKKRTYDLFKASRLGDLSQDPYVRPGDVITVNRIKRKVTLSGAVERPGTYELMKDENLKELIEYYGGGLTDLADTSRISLNRYIEGNEGDSGKTIYLNEKDINSGFVLNNRDYVYIAGLTSEKHYITIEGIIDAPITGDVYKDSDRNPNTLLKRAITFLPGTNYANFIRTNKGIFNNYSDLANIYIERNDSQLWIDAEKVIYDATYVSEYFVEDGDIMHVPFQQAYNTIFVTGEVVQSFERTAWPMVRLSTVLRTDALDASETNSPILTNYSSVRNVEVTSIDGTKKVYDLFKAKRFGDMSQNPYIKAGETVTVKRVERKVTINGAVERPDVYELLEGENLKELVEYYGGGLTDLADTSRISLNRYIEGNEGDSGKTIYLNEKDIDSGFVLNNRDSVYIAGLTSEKHYITVEGIIDTPITGEVYRDSDRNPNTLLKRAITFLPGTNYANFIRANKGIFNSYSDLANIYIERNDSQLWIDAEKVIYDATYVSEYFVEDEDIMHVPFQQAYNTIFVTGEVVQSFERTAWPMVRLSTILKTDALDASEINSPILTNYSSVRNVEVTSIDGTKKVYDLFKAKRFGDMSQNPYIKAGETVTVKRVERKVTIRGAVERPDVYELLEGENLKELVDYYGGGLSDFADTSRIELIRYNTSDKNSNTVYLTEKNIEENLELKDHDSVLITAITDLRPVMFIEGALSSAESEKAVAVAEMDKLTVRFDNDTNYAYLIRRYAKYFASTADLDHAYIIRGNTTIQIDINKILYDRSYFSDEIVQPYDLLRIPFKLNYVTVSGAVQNPGRYPYIPDRDWEYYIGLAGGFIETKNIGSSVEIRDVNGNKLSKKDTILPETTINAKSDRLTYLINQNVTPWLTIITSLCSSAAVVLSIIQLVK